MAQYGPTKIDMNKIKQSIASKTPVKEVVGSVSTQQPMQSTLQPQTQRTQATSTIGGISSPFGATNINNKPTFPETTPAQLGEEQKFISSQPKVPTTLPATGSEKLSIDQFAEKIKEKYPEYSGKDNKILAEAMIKKYPEYADKVELQNKSNFIENLGSGIAQSVTGFGNLGKSLAFGAVDLYRKAKGKEELTPEQKAQVEQTPMGQALNTITNRQTPEQKASVGGQIGMVAGSVAQGAALGTPISNAVSKIPLVANIVSKAPTLSKIAGGIGQGLEGQAQYSLSAEGRLPTGKELLTAGAFGGAVNAIGPIAKGIKEMKAPKVPKIGSPVEYIAKKVTGTVEPQGKLFKAQEPRTNQLNKAVDYKNLRANSDIANEEILKAGYKPTDTASRAVAHADTMKKIWNEEIQSKVGNQFDVDLAPVANSIDEFIAKQKTAGLIKNEGQLAELKAQADKFRKMGKVNGADAEFTKEMINAQINNRGDSSIGDVYKNGMKEATKKLGAILDDTFSAIPGKFAEAKRRFGALKATYQDVVKADIKAQKAKGLGLEETFSRIEGFGDIIGSLGSGKNTLPGLLKGGAKVLMGKVLAKVKDKDFLIKEGFEELSKKIQPKQNINISKLSNRQKLPYIPTKAPAPIVIGEKGIIQTPTPPKPTIKGNITAETGKIGISYPKVIESAKNAPKTTVIPSVSAPKIDTFKRLTELDTDPSFKKITGREVLGGGKIKQGLYETEYGPIQSTFMDRTVEKVKVGDKTFNRGDVTIFEKTPIDPAKIAGEKALQELKAIEQGQGKTFASNLRAILDDFGIKKVDDIPEGSEQDILQLVRARKAPKINLNKLGKETLESNITDTADNLVNEARKYKSADDMIKSMEDEGYFVYHGTKSDWEVFDISKGFRQRYGNAFYGTKIKDKAASYGSIKNIYLDKDIKIFNQSSQKSKSKYIYQDSNISDYFKENKLTSEEKIKYLKEKGYDGLMAGDEHVIFNVDKIKTESQLRKIREEANKLPPKTK